MTPNAKATAHQRVPVGRCGVALPVFPKNSQIFIIPRGIITVNTVPELKSSNDYLPLTLSTVIQLLQNSVSPISPFFLQEKKLFFIKKCFN